MVNDEPIDKENSVKRWFRKGMVRAKQKDTFIILIIGYLLAMFLLLEMYFVVPGISTGLGILVDYALISLIYMVCIGLVRRLVVPLLKFLYMNNFSFIFTMSVAIFIQTYIITKQIGWNTKVSVLFASVVLVLTLLIALSMALVWVKRKAWTWYVASLWIMMFIVTFSVIKYEQLNEVNVIVEPQLFHEILIEQQEEIIYKPVQITDNPIEPGQYAYTHLTYSSKSDLVQTVFARDEQLKYESLSFPTVDGSSILKDWSWAKELYWGFSEQNIPINGEIWMPDGEGPFPIVYIMHGNHISETDSSIGYNYLAELLATHGYIVSSIDANFLNFSAWSGIVDDDMLLRAWLFLAHIDTFFDAQILPVDWNNVALIGHSRGGQAAAMAADISKWLENNEQAAIVDKVNINAVIGLAPTDYQIAGKLPNLSGINYLTIHGTLDADLTEFFGERQFERTSISDDYYKASVIIYGANHGQFNETWGKYDDQFPAALLLNTTHILDEATQQQAAKVFVSGFLQSIFDKKHHYRQLFQDTRVGHPYLPIAGYVTQYEDNNMDIYYSFENGYKQKNIEYSDNTSIETIELKGRNGSSKYNDVLKVRWEAGESKLEVPITNQMLGYKADEIKAFVFQVAKTQESPNETVITDMNIEVDFITKNAQSRVNLNNSFMLLDPYLPIYLKLDFLEDDIKKGKYEPKEEPYLQTYIIPLALIEKGLKPNQEWDIQQLTSLHIHFYDKNGEVLIDDIGVIYEGGSYVEYE